jgi:hypothetical protein
MVTSVFVEPEAQARRYEALLRLSRTITARTPESVAPRPGWGSKSFLVRTRLRRYKEPSTFSTLDSSSESLLSEPVCVSAN